MFFEIFATPIVGLILMIIGYCLIKYRENIKKCFLCSGEVGSCLYILGLSIFASWHLDDLIKDRLPDAFKYVSLNSFWSILFASIGLSFVLEDLKEVWKTETPQEKSKNSDNSKAKDTDALDPSKEEKNTKSTPLLGNNNDESKQISESFFAKLNPFNRFAKKR